MCCVIEARGIDKNGDDLYEMYSAAVEAYNIHLEQGESPPDSEVCKGHSANPRGLMMAIKKAVGKAWEYERAGAKNVIVYQLADPCHQSHEISAPFDVSGLCLAALHRDERS